VEGVSFGPADAAIVDCEGAEIAITTQETPELAETST
jgi:hypothetical protein